MTTSQIVWREGTLSDFTFKDQIVNHNLHQSPLFTDEGLIKIIDAYPFDRLEVFTMGYDPRGWGEWYLGRRGNLDGRQLLEAVKNGRIWLNLRQCCEYNPLVKAESDKLFAEIKEKTGVATFKHDMGLLISSPNAHVYYHADMPPVLLVQIRGIKKVYLFPPNLPFISDKDKEAIAIKEHDEQLEYKPEWDETAFIHDLKPGEFASWRQNGPHRIVNHDCMNVSFSIEFMTAQSLWRANLLYANGCLRRYFGLNPSLEKSWKILEPLKIIYARIVKLMGGFKGHRSVRQPCFSLDETQLGVIHFDEGVVPPIQKKAA